MRNIYLLNSRFTLPFAFVLAVSLLAVSLMFMLPGGLLHAQESDDTIQYPENGTGPVATFTAIDPEGESITWTLDGHDAAAFSIENGVLRFENPPDYEDTENTDHMYAVTVRASDGGLDTTATEAVTVQVTNVEEAGMIMLSTLQPQVGVAITATLTDGDNIGADNLASISWQWYRGNTPIAGATDKGNDSITSMYTPAAGDIGSVLRATAMYDDDEGDDKTAQQDSAHAAREAPTSNVTPTFPTPSGQPSGEENTNQTREITENTPAGTNIGAPVAASDTDVLTYSLNDSDDAANFDINRATGHIVTKEPLDHENEGPYSLMVTATDPFGAVAMVTVAISVTDVNEAPTVTGASSIDHAENGIVLDIDAETENVVDAAEYTATDEDMDDDAGTGLTWLLSGADASKFEITDSGAVRTLSFEAMPNFESPGDSDGNNVYEVTVMVTDSEGNTDSQAVMVKVTNVEETGAIDFSTLQPRVGFPVTATLTDPDNVNADSLEWQWYRSATDNIPTIECAADDSDNCLIKDATSGTYRPTAGDAEKRLTAVATYTDGHANEEDAKDMVIERGANDVLTSTANQAPVFMDQDDEMEGRQTAQERSIAENSPAMTNNDPTPIGDEVEADDEDSNLTYSLGGPDAASFAIDRSSGQLQVKADLDKETKDTYTVTVTATDSLGLSSTITVTINVTDEDEMPDLEGEAPEEYAENGTAVVATFTARDPEGKAIVWSLAAGTDAAAFSIENGVLRFEESPDYEDADNTAHMYVVTVQASDGGGTPTTKEVTIEVTNVEEPGTVTLSTLQPQVDRDITATLDDPDNEDVNTVTWQWYRGSSPISGANAGVNMVISTYTPAAGDIGSGLRAQAMYDDGEGEDKTARGVSSRSVRNAPASNTAPTFPDQTPSTQAIDKTQAREVAENVPVGTNLGAPVVANDPGDVLTYSLSGNNATSFDINRATGQLTTKVALNFEDSSNPLNNEFMVTVTATDPSGAPDMATVNITLTDVNENPTFNDGSVASIDHEENTTVLDVDAADDNLNAAEYTVSDPDTTADRVASLKWSLSGADASKFAITPNGGTRMLSFEEAPDYENPGDSDRNNVYEVTLVVTDSEGNTAEHSVTVKVTNMEELGTVELSTLQPRISFPITATLTDPDNITAGSVSWQWYKGNVTEQDLGMLDETECVDATSSNCFIKGATSATYTPVVVDVNDLVIVVALYTDGRPNAVADGKDFAMMATMNPVLADTRNKAPVFPDQDMEMEGRQTAQERMIGENELATALVREIGAPVIAMDFIIAPETGIPTSETLTYSLGGADAASFDIDRATGQLSTKAELDYETKDTYTVTVTATDPSGETATVMVTIKVTDVDEAPTIMVGGLAISGRNSVSYAENDTDAVATYTAVGPESALTTWSLSGDDASLFSITAGGELSFRAAPDFEMQADADTNNVYMVTIEADDGTNTNSFNVTVRVTNVDEQAETGVLGMYDTNRNGQIDRSEIVAAITDYQALRLTRAQMVEIITLYQR